MGGGSCPVADFCVSSSSIGIFGSTVTVLLKIYDLCAFFVSMYKVKLGVTFHNMLAFCGEELLAPARPPGWKTTPCQLFATAYSVYKGKSEKVRFPIYFCESYAHIAM